VAAPLGFVGQAKWGLGHCHGRGYDLHVNWFEMIKITSVAGERPTKGNVCGSMLAQSFSFSFLNELTLQLQLKHKICS
jgi:hypothetical protein